MALKSLSSNESYGTSFIVTFLMPPETFLESAWLVNGDDPNADQWALANGLLESAVSLPLKAEKPGELVRKGSFS